MADDALREAAAQAAPGMFPGSSQQSAASADDFNTSSTSGAQQAAAPRYTVGGTLGSHDSNSSGPAPLQGYDVGVWVRDLGYNGGTGNTVLLGQFNSIVITVRNISDPYVAVGFRQPLYLDGEVQIAFTLEKGLLDMDVFTETFGFNRMHREFRFNRTPRFEISFCVDPVDWVALSQTSYQLNEGITRKPVGRFVLGGCKIEAFNLGASAGKSVVATQWHGVAHSIIAEPSEPDIEQGKSQSVTAVKTDGGYGGKANVANTNTKKDSFSVSSASESWFEKGKGTAQGVINSLNNLKRGWGIDAPWLDNGINSVQGALNSLNSVASTAGEGTKKNKLDDVSTATGQGTKQDKLDDVSTATGQGTKKNNPDDVSTAGEGTSQQTSADRVSEASAVSTETIKKGLRDALTALRINIAKETNPFVKTVLKTLLDASINALSVEVNKEPKPSELRAGRITDAYGNVKVGVGQEYTASQIREGAITNSDGTIKVTASTDAAAGVVNGDGTALTQSQATIDSVEELKVALLGKQYDLNTTLASETDPAKKQAIEYKLEEIKKALDSAEVFSSVAYEKNLVASTYAASTADTPQSGSPTLASSLKEGSITNADGTIKLGPGTTPAGANGNGALTAMSQAFIDSAEQVKLALNTRKIALQVEQQRAAGPADKKKIEAQIAAIDEAIAAASVYASVAYESKNLEGVASSSSTADAAGKILPATNVSGTESTGSSTNKADTPSSGGEGTKMADSKASEAKGAGAKSPEAPASGAGEGKAGGSDKPSEA